MGRTSHCISCQRGASAVEFALVAPVFVLLVAGIIAYASIFATQNGVQQLAAEAARATVAGLNDTERDQLARAYVTRSVGTYPYLIASRLSVSTTPVGNPTTSFQVQLTYDNSNAFAYQFSGVLPLPPGNVVRSAILQRGGY